MEIRRFENANISVMTDNEIICMFQKWEALYNRFTKKYRGEFCTANLSFRTLSARQRKHLDRLYNQMKMWEDAALKTAKNPYHKIG